MAFKARGFTLVEVMVVLAIVSLCSVLMLQMLTVFLRGYDQVNRIQSEIILDSMRENWFRRSVKVMVASHDEEFGFQGEEYEISGYTLYPLIGPGGKLTEVGWLIRSNSSGASLWYTETDFEPMKIANWANASLKFQYRGLSSGWVSEWPPREIPIGELPQRIKLTIEGNGSSRAIFAAVAIRRVKGSDYRDIL